MLAELNQTSHRRYNILTGDWVLVSPHRTKRPWQGQTEKALSLPQQAYDPSCYLCPKNQRAGGLVNPDYQETFVFQNDFSAILQGEVMHFEKGLLRAEVETGICRVVCFSPHHSLTLPLMSVESIAQVIKVWQKEYQELGANPEINYVQIFENKGALMGCSNPHPHGQIWAQSSIPSEVLKKTQKQQEYWKQHQRSLLGDYLQQELECQERILIENADFVALVPYWAVWPYEAMILPKKHHQHINQLGEQERMSFAEVIKKLTTMYDNLFQTSFPYSAGIHQAPTDNTPQEAWHFHLSFYPPLLRSATVKKFMVGYEMFACPQRDITPELAISTLKSLPSRHYSLER